jgi:PRTRC genetic system protein C
VFAELMPLLQERTLLITVARVEEKVKVNVIPTKVREGEDHALTTPLSFTGFSRRTGFRIREASCQLCGVSPGARQHLGRSKGRNGRGGEGRTSKSQSDTGSEDRSRYCQEGGSHNVTKHDRCNAKSVCAAAIDRAFRVLACRRKENDMIDAKVLSRRFTYNGVKLPDPDPRMTPEEVKVAYSHQYPDLATAAITGPEASGEQLVYSFVRAIGTKG